jgi:glycosyltransferase involved in cell wall biosynthesis
MQNTQPIICIGIPVYNGEDVLKERLKSIIKQSFSNFEIFISDNGSTDKTQEICEKMCKEDKRITYVRNEENKGGYWNFNFVLKQAKTKYFVWTAADDIWSQKFLEKNIGILEKNENIVGSIGELSIFNRIKDPLTNKMKVKVLKNTKKFQYIHPVFGEKYQKIKFLLNFSMGSFVYAVFRTNKLQKAIPIESYENSMWMGDLACSLSVIQEGDFEVIESAFVYKHQTERSTSIIEYMRKGKWSLKQILFLNFPFTFWCVKNLGIKIFLKNFVYFIKLNIEGEYSIVAEIVRMCKRKIFRQKKYW